jgi:tellurite resistance protein
MSHDQEANAMNRDESEACLRILFTVAIADGRVSTDEERALAVLAGYDGGADVPAVIDIPKEVLRIKSPAARRATFDAAVAIAEVDGRCSPEEHALLEQLRTALGIADAPPLDTAEHQWEEQLREPLQQLAREEVSFLHKLASDRDKLSEDTYAALVEDLRERRTRILAEALSPAAVR